MHNDARVEKLEQRVKALEDEVRSLKQALETTTYETKIKNESLPKQQLNKRKGTFENLNEPKEKVDFEQRLTQSWLPRVFMTVLLLGVLWGFKVAIDFGILTPFVRVMIGFVAGLGISYLGFQQMKKNREKLGIVLFGGAYSILLFTTFAANILYGYIPSSLAFLLNIAWLFSGLFLTKKFNAQSLGIFIALGGYLIPFLIESYDPSPWLFTIFETFLYIVLLYFSLRMQYVYLYFMAFITLHLTFFVFLITTFGVNSYSVNSLVYGVITQFIFITIMYLKRNLFLKQQLTLLFTSFMMTTAWVTLGFDRIEQELFSYVVTVVFIVMTLYIFNKNKERMVSLSVVSSVSLLISLSYLFGVNWLTFIGLVEGTALLFLGWYLGANLQKVTGALIYTISFLVSIEYSIESLLSIDSLVWLTLLLTLGCILYGVNKYEGNSKIARWGIALANILIWLHYTTLLIPLLLQGVNENVIQIINSFVWAILAVVIVLTGIYKNIQFARLVGIGVLFITLFKVIFIDLFMVSIALRSILFIGLGVIGIVVSRLFYKKSS